MNEMQLIKTLEKLAHYVVRNEIVCEYFLTQELPVSPEEICEKVNEVDSQLDANITEWMPNRFPDLWEMTYNTESLED
jgi:Mn-dependent DtxR family transcriptional regulator